MSSIVLKQLKFSNMFSYGENNVINLDTSRITQLTAPNGSGKSSRKLIFLIVGLRVSLGTLH